MSPVIFIGLAICCAGLSTATHAQESPMSFFITSVNPGKGANLGGLEGADAHCAALAEAAGITGTDWAAYLSNGTENARDRIGTSPLGECRWGCRRRKRRQPA